MSPRGMSCYSFFFSRSLPLSLSLCLPFCLSVSLFFFVISICLPLSLSIAITLNLGKLKDTVRIRIIDPEPWQLLLLYRVASTKEEQFQVSESGWRVFFYRILVPKKPDTIFLLLKSGSEYLALTLFRNGSTKKKVPGLRIRVDCFLSRIRIIGFWNPDLSTEHWSCYCTDLVLSICGSGYIAATYANCKDQEAITAWSLY